MSSIISTKDRHYPETSPKSFAIDSNIFSWNLIKQLKPNSVSAPLSIYYILGILQLASKANTKKQLTMILHREIAFDELISIGKIITLSNLLIINNKIQINKKFIDKISDIAYIKLADFANKEVVVQTANKFIETNTRGLINNVIKPEHIDHLSMLVLINVIYFKSNWLYPFDKTLTKKLPFNNIETDMMTIAELFYYGETDSMQLVELPYEGNKFAMGFMLKKKFKSESRDMSKTLVQVSIPKFTQRSNIDLIPVLKKMGLTDIFDCEKARLDDLSTKMYVSVMLHEAVVIVDEEGTEAAAVTVVVSRQMIAMPMVSPKPIIFNANRSFLYYIKHLESGMIIFMGDYQG